MLRCWFSDLDELAGLIMMPTWNERRGREGREDLQDSQGGIRTKKEPGQWKTVSAMVVVCMPRTGTDARAVESYMTDQSRREGGVGEKIIIKIIIIKI